MNLNNVLIIGGCTLLGAAAGAGAMYYVKEKQYAALLDDYNDLLVKNHVLADCVNSEEPIEVAEDYKEDYETDVEWDDLMDDFNEHVQERVKDDGIDWGEAQFYEDDLSPFEELKKRKLQAQCTDDEDDHENYLEYYYDGYDWGNNEYLGFDAGWARIWRTDDNYYMVVTKRDLDIDDSDEDVIVPMVVDGKLNPEFTNEWGYERIIDPLEYFDEMSDLMVLGDDGRLSDDDISCRWVTYIRNYRTMHDWQITNEIGIEINTNPYSGVVTTEFGKTDYQDILDNAHLVEPPIE
jgi:hypothetical protein